MTCVHLRQLFNLCQENDIKLGGSDLIRIVCNQCGEQEVCPSVLVDEYDARHADDPSDPPGAEATPEQPRGGKPAVD